MSHLSLEAVFELMSIPAVTVWERLYSSHRPYFDALKHVEFYGQSRRVRDIGKRIGGSGRPHFGLSWDQQRLDYGHVTNDDLSLVLIIDCVQDEEDAEAWLAPFMADDAFRQARLYETGYEYWQNAADPLQYEAGGRSYEGLPMRSNGFPPPVEQMVIDTSRNPGRRVLRRGFIEAVGSPMWLGESFWSVTGTRREAVCAEEWLRCETRRGSVVRLRPADAPFTTAEGQAGEVQERLRRLLYPPSSAA